MSLRLIYLASPYTHKNKAVQRQRFRFVRNASARLMERNLHIFSPIVHGHCIDQVALTIPYQNWIRWGLDMLRRSDAVWVLMLDGWLESTGLAHERQYAHVLGKPLLYLTFPELRLLECPHGSNTFRQELPIDGGNSPPRSPEHRLRGPRKDLRPSE